jgi:phytoene dehydrogenase-like protein
MSLSRPDAIVIGSGPNGLVAANVLAAAGWAVQVFEAAPVPGGAVRSAELTVPGFRHDVFSAFYPFAAGSPVMQALHLEDQGLVWCRSPAVLGHPVPDGPAALMFTDRRATQASLDAFAPGDGEGWSRLFATWDRASGPLVDALFQPFPPVRSAARLAAALGFEGSRRFVRDALLPVRRMADEYFTGQGAKLLLGGLALHADLSPEAAGSGLYGWLLAALGERHGFPVPQGGAQELTKALVRRLETLGGCVTCDAHVDGIEVLGGRAVGVRVHDRVVRARRAVLADVAAPALYGALVARHLLPERVLAAVLHYEPGAATVKVDWALDTPVPWTHGELAQAGTVHLADSMESLSVYAQQLASGRLPDRPFLLFGQMATADPTRSPTGTDTAWAYTHVPQTFTGWTPQVRDEFVARMERIVEDYAPGFGAKVLGRHVLAPPDFTAWNENLVGGDTMGGTTQIHQQLVFRPLPGLGRAETPIKGLYLASASAHPGGGVHGGPGSNAARAALFHARLRRQSR